MLELFLFLGTFCVFFFLPVQFQIQYRHDVEARNRLVFELSFLNGRVSRKKEVVFHSRPAANGTQGVQKETHWFGFHKKKGLRTITPSFITNPSSGAEFGQRLRNYGLGVTALTYFLPAEYHRWILVAESLEKRGAFHRLQWNIQIGTDDAALTAIAVGIIQGFLEGLTSYLRSQYRFARPPELGVYPDFNRRKLEMMFDGIFRVKLGYIIIAALIAKFRYPGRKGGVRT